MPTLKTQLCVRKIDRIFERFLAARDATEREPSAALFAAWGVFLVTTRCSRSLSIGLYRVDSARLGRGKMVVESYLVFTEVFVVPARFPAWVASMTRVEYRTLWDDVRRVRAAGQRGSGISRFQMGAEASARGAGIRMNA